MPTSSGDYVYPGAYWGYNGYSQTRLEQWNGMSLRAYLCAHAPHCPAGFGCDYPEPIRHAKWRLAYADAQIALLEGREP